MRRTHPRLLLFGVVLLLAYAVPAAAGARDDQTARSNQGGGVAGDAGVAPRAQDMTLIDHIVVIMQENRSFDHYFGTYHSPSGAHVEGLPKKPSGQFAVCIPDPALGHCVKPYHSGTPKQIGGPHGWHDSVRDVNRGKMNGFAESVALAHDSTMRFCATNPFTKRCRPQTGPNGEPDVMSFFTRADIPNYYALADWGVLQDHMFEPVDSYSLPSHMFLTSAWAATCTNPMDPMSCHSDPQVKGNGPYPWTDITWLLDKEGVSWKYYVGDGTNLSCPKYPCAPNNPKTATPALWNPVPGFLTVQENHSLGRIQHTSDFFSDAANGTLPQVSFVIPGGSVSEHPQHGSMVPGYAYVSRAINALSTGPNWPSTAIFLNWDDWGGFYDHVRPPNVDSLGYGIRAPGIVLSPYAKEAYVDHQTLSSDAYLKFIEDRFLGGQRLDPKNDGRKDSRPGVREAKPILGDMTSDFDFTQVPRTLPILDPTNAGF